ncbi:MAG: ASCH domain-containing protein [Phycisphaerae bacterium]|nr:ASCH domain-containing protein [Phycisphaerae bacterium]
MIHVAVVHAPYVEAILSRRKTIESRLSRVRCDPFGTVYSGERVYFKARGGAVLATAIVAGVYSFQDLTARRVSKIRREFGGAIGAPPEYWESKSSARFATLMRLADVERVRFGPRFPVFYGRAWQRLPDSSDVYPRCLHPDQRVCAG